MPERQAERQLESVALHEFRIAENIATGAVGNNPAAIEQNRPGADFQDHLEVMRGNELGRGKGPDQVNEPAPAAGIEICGRLVEHKHRGPARQDPRQAYPFSLAEAEVMGWTISQVTKTDPGKAFPRDLTCLVLACPLVERTESHVLEHCRAEELIIRILKQEAHFAADLGRGAVIDLDAIDPDARRPAAVPAGEGEIVMMPQIRTPLTG